MSSPSSITFLFIASALLAVVQLTPVSVNVDRCAGAAKLAKDDPAIRTSPAKASIQLARANAAVTSLEARHSVKMRVHDTKLKSFTQALEALEKARLERETASNLVSETENLLTHYEDEYIEASVQARNPTIPYRTKKKVVYRGYDHSYYETITDYNRALIKAAQDKMDRYNEYMKAKSQQAPKIAAFNLKDRLFKQAESNLERAKEAFQSAKLDMETTENDLNEAKSTRDGAKFLYDNAVQYTKKGSKKSLDVPSEECKPKYQRYG
ncbi:hypothetical protein DdX_16537 [Ditylenchus destructor]|uniref:Uncharacterized protein n=1 Tax=Ditylenchus destructor TaxID=166010 RepID=A0AAD4MNU7_9BILA|nr:hypothetical protein DdX_16537 [Ditylenchus destructor]